MQFSLEIWGTDYPKIKDTCILSEKLGFYGFFYGESLSKIDLDCWTIISALSTPTNRIKLGPVITYLLPHYRSIALLAKQALTLQEISGGRLEFRTGAGATSHFSVPWWYPYGIDYPNERERVSILEEGLKVLVLLWDNDKSEIQLQGKYFELHGASIKLPQSNIDKQIPITVAAKGNKTMDIAAKYADMWETSYLTPQEFLEADNKFKQIMISEKVKRNMRKSIELDVIIGESNSDLSYKERRYSIQRGSRALDQVKKKGLVGKPDDIANRIQEYTNVGIDHFFLAFQDPFDTTSLRLFANVINTLG